MANAHANSQYETNKLPGFNKEPFDGKPVYFFDKIWFIPFIVACGNIQQDGWTLHQTFYGNDLGGANNQGGNAAQQAQHRLRVHRLYNVLMHHLKPDTSLYRELSEPEWVSEGILAWLLWQWVLSMSSCTPHCPGAHYPFGPIARARDTTTTVP